LERNSNEKRSVRTGSERNNARPTESELVPTEPTTGIGEWGENAQYNNYIEETIKRW